MIVDTLFRRVDVLLAPMATEPMTVIGNMTGHPCLTIRAGFTDVRTREMPALLNAESKEMGRRSAAKPGLTMPSGSVPRRQV